MIFSNQGWVDTSIHRIIALVVIWSAVGWGFLHRRGVKEELVQDEAIPEPAPRALLTVVLITVLLGFSSLLLYMVFG